MLHVLFLFFKVRKCTRNKVIKKSDWRKLPQNLRNNRIALQLSNHHHNHHQVNNFNVLCKPCSTTQFVKKDSNELWSTATTDCRQDVKFQNRLLSKSRTTKKKEKKKCIILKYRTDSILRRTIQSQTMSNNSGKYKARTQS